MPFDVAFVAASTSNAGVEGAGPISWTLDVGAGLYRLLVVAFVGTGRPTAPTYNSVPLVFYDTVGPALHGRSMDVWYLPNPASGAHAVTGSDGASWLAIALSYSGCRQAGFPDAGQKITAISDPFVGTVTTTRDRCWVVMFADASGPRGTAGPGTTLRQDTAGFAFQGWDSNGPKTPPGVTSLTVHSGSLSPTPVNTITVSIAPFAGADKMFAVF